MLVYNYDPDTGVYNNTASEADPDPLEPGKWLVPANATVLTPPFHIDSQRARFDGFKWVVEDIPMPPAIHDNVKNAPNSGVLGEGAQKLMWPRLSIKEAFKGGVT